jgi:hypothetical protein
MRDPRDLFTRIKYLLQLGWRVVTELHTVQWVLFGILTISPGAIILALLQYFGEHSLALLVITFAIVTAAIVLIGLASLGHYREPMLHRVRRLTPPAGAVGDAKPIPNMLVKEAAEHLAATNASWDAASDEVWTELREAARQGRITVWGRPESAHLERPYKPMEEIPPDHWRHYAFDFLRCMHSEDEARCRSEPDDPKRYPLNKGYADLRVNTTQVQTSWVAKIPSNALTIEISDGAPFNIYKKRLHIKTHLIRIGVVNGIYDHAVTNCQLHLEHISGPFSDQCPVTIKQNFTINGAAREYIPFVEFDERINKDMPAPSKPGLITLYFPLTRPLSNGISYLDAGSYELTLLATSAETPPARQKCRLVLEDGFLSLQRL